MENTNKDKTKEINQRGRGTLPFLVLWVVENHHRTAIGSKVGWQFMDTDDLIEEKTSLSISNF